MTTLRVISYGGSGEGRRAPKHHTEASQRTHRLHRGFTEDSQRTRRGLAENSQRTHRGLTEDSQRTHRGLAEGSQRIHRGATEDSQRTRRRPTEDSLRIHKGFAEDLPSEAVLDTGFNEILLARYAPRMGFKRIRHKPHAIYACFMKDHLHKTHVKHPQ